MPVPLKTFNSSQATALALVHRTVVNTLKGSRAVDGIGNSAVFEGLSPNFTQIIYKSSNPTQKTHKCLFKSQLSNAVRNVISVSSVIHLCLCMQSILMN
jgi:hypothetical protein